MTHGLEPPSCRMQHLGCARQLPDPPAPLSCVHLPVHLQVGVVQKRYLNALGCLWFNRTQSNDRTLVARRMREHVASPDSTPLLIFPEGTCVNNEYCVMFKRGAFDLGA